MTSYWKKNSKKTSAIVVNSELSDNFGNLMNITKRSSPRNQDSARRRSFTEQIKETVGKTVNNLFGTKNKVRPKVLGAVTAVRMQSQKKEGKN